MQPRLARREWALAALAALVAPALGGCIFSDAPEVPVRFSPLSLTEGDSFEWQFDEGPGSVTLTIGAPYRVRGPDQEWVDVVPYLTTLAGFEFLGGNDSRVVEFVGSKTGEVILRSDACLVNGEGCAGPITLAWRPGPSGALFGSTLLGGRPISNAETIAFGDALRGLDHSLSVTVADGELTVGPRADTVATDSFGCNVFEHSVSFESGSSIPRQCSTGDGSYRLRAHTRGEGHPHVLVVAENRTARVSNGSFLTLESLLPGAPGVVGHPAFALHEALSYYENSSEFHEFAAQNDVHALTRAFFVGTGTQCTALVCEADATWRIEVTSSKGTRLAAEVTKASLEAVDAAELEAEFASSSGHPQFARVATEVLAPEAAQHVASKLLEHDALQMSVHSRTYRDLSTMVYFFREPTPAGAPPSASPGPMVQFDAISGRLIQHQISEHEVADWVIPATT